MNRPLMNSLCLLGCKTSLSAPVWWSLGVSMGFHSRERPSCFRHLGHSGMLWALCIQHFSCSPCSPSISRLLTMSLMPEANMELLLCHWNLQTWKYHRTWARDWQIWLVIRMDWMSTYRLYISRNSTVEAGPCVVAGMWPESGLSHAMECWPVP